MAAVAYYGQYVRTSADVVRAHLSLAPDREGIEHDPILRKVRGGIDEHDRGDHREHRAQKLGVRRGEDHHRHLRLNSEDCKPF